MVRLPRITATELLRALHRDGWSESRRVGKHLQLRYDRKPGHVTVPVHPGEIIKPKTLGTILDQAGLTADDLRSLL